MLKTPQAPRRKQSHQGFGPEIGLGAAGYGRPDDLELLNALASLTDTRPHDLLRTISWRAGQKADGAALLEGRPLPVATRTLLQKVLDERLRVEQDIVETCRGKSAQIVQVCLAFLVLGALMGVLFF